MWIESRKASSVQAVPNVYQRWHQGEVWGVRDTSGKTIAALWNLQLWMLYIYMYTHLPENIPNGYLNKTVTAGKVKALIAQFLLLWIRGGADNNWSLLQSHVTWEWQRVITVVRPEVSSLWLFVLKQIKKKIVYTVDTCHSFLFCVKALLSHDYSLSLYLSTLNAWIYEV